MTSNPPASPQPPARLPYALKEWSIVCDLLQEAKLALLLRKGGIHESSGPGVFELEHPWFALFPSWAHQKPEMIKPEHRPRVQVIAEPPSIPLNAFAHAARIWQIHSRASFDHLEPLHCWTKAQIDMRFDYKPQNPLYLMAVRVYRLPLPATIPNHAEYAGCKSWVPLRPDEEPQALPAQPVMTDDAFASLIAQVDQHLA
jgi:hypothetical protein